MTVNRSSRSAPLLRGFLSALGLVFLAACSSTMAEKPAESAEEGARRERMACTTPGLWLRPSDGTRLDAPAFLAETAGRAVVLLGERHDQAEDHRWQLQTLAALHSRRPDMVLGFEAFPRSVQPVLDCWVAGDLTEAAFLEQVRWQEVWGFDPALYLPLFHFARMNRIPIQALNVERALVRRVGREGWDSVPEEERRGLSAPAPALPAYLDRLAETYGEHLQRRRAMMAHLKARQAERLPPDHGRKAKAEGKPLPPDHPKVASRETPDTPETPETPGTPETPEAPEPPETREAPEAAPGKLEAFDRTDPGFRNFVAAQQVWDRAMAEGILEAKKRPGAGLVVAVIGSGHLDYGHGVAHQLRALGVEDIATLRPFVLTAAPDQGTGTETGAETGAETGTVAEGQTEAASGADCLPPAAIADAVFTLRPLAEPIPAAKPRLGIRIESMMDSSRGLVVAEVMDGAAAQGVLKPGDVLRRAAGQPLDSLSDLTELLDRLPWGVWLPLDVERGGETQTLVVEFPALP